MTKRFQDFPFPPESFLARERSVNLATKQNIRNRAAAPGDGPWLWWPVDLPSRFWRSRDGHGLAPTLFEDVNPNPVEKNVQDGVEAYRRGKCDGVIGLGGGSPIDVAKAIRLAETHPLPLEEYDDQLDGSAKIRDDVPPMIAIATTAGTGSEVGRSTVIILKSTDRKTVIFSPYLMPNVALADPELTLGMPPKITAGTGLDALTHNVEAYLALRLPSPVRRHRSSGSPAGHSESSAGGSKRKRPGSAKQHDDGGNDGGRGVSKGVGRRALPCSSSLQYCQLASWHHEWDPLAARAGVQPPNLRRTPEGPGRRYGSCWFSGVGRGGCHGAYRPAARTLAGGRHS